MKIIYLANSTIPSHEANSVHVMKMCQAFAKNGHNTTLITRKRKKEDSGVNVFEHYGVEPIFNIKEITRRIIPKIGGLLYYAKYSLSLPKFNRKNVLIYGRHLRGLYFASREGLPCVLEVHVPPKDERDRWYQEKIMTSSSFRRMVVITKALKDEYLKLFPILKEEDILVAPDAADVPVGVEKKSIANISKNKRLQIGYVGSLYWGKGVEIILKLADEISDVDFQIVGGRKEDVDFWIKKNKNKNVFFHGFVPHGKLSEYYNSFDIVLAPFQRKVFLSDNESDIGKWTSPLKMFEYMAAAKPIIASDLNVLREVLIPERNALLASPENVDEWASCLVRLKNDPMLRKRLGNEALKNFLSNYTWKARAVKIIEE